MPRATSASIPGHDVAVVAAAPVVDVGAQELLAVVRAAARIRIEHGPALARPQLTAFQAAHAIVVHVRAGWPAVGDDQERIPLARFEADRLEQHAFDRPPVALPGDDLAGAERELGRLRVRGRQPVEGAEVRAGHVDVVRRLGRVLQDRDDRPVTALRAELQGAAFGEGGVSRGGDVVREHGGVGTLTRREDDAAAIRAPLRRRGFEIERRRR